MAFRNAKRGDLDQAAFRATQERVSMGLENILASWELARTKEAFQMDCWLAEAFRRLAKMCSLLSLFLSPFPHFQVSLDNKSKLSIGNEARSCTVKRVTVKI